MSNGQGSQSDRSASPTGTRHPLPHDRDEAPDAADGHREADANREPIRQAHDDVESGIKDTERIGTPNDVPTSTGRSTS